MTTVDICGVPTSIAVSAHSDCIKVIITQTGKFGSWYRVSRAQSPGMYSDDSAAVFSVDVLLGDPNDFYGCGVARALCEAVAGIRADSGPLILALALANPKVPPTHETVQGLVSALTRIMTRS